ncbi:MAG: DUF3313 family protein [Gammaproteobacteria bacterium]
MRQNQTIRLVFPVLLGALMMAACSTQPSQPVIGAEESFDGLRRITNSRADAAWIRPGVDLSAYRKLRLEGAGIEFRPEQRTGASRREFSMSEVQKTRLREVVVEIFREELSASERFSLVEESGPDVLTVWGGLYDVVSFVPPEQAGRRDVFLSQVGAATLVIELRDSETGATLLRALDRRAASRAGSQLNFSSSASNWSEVRRVARRWATLLRTRLDSIDSWSVETS